MALVMEKTFIYRFPVNAYSNLATHLHEFHSDGLLLIATSIVKLIEGCALFSVARKVVAVGMTCNAAKVSST